MVFLVVQVVALVQLLELLVQALAGKDMQVVLVVHLHLTHLVAVEEPTQLVVMALEAHLELVVQVHQAQFLVLLLLTQAAAEQVVLLLEQQQVQVVLEAAVQAAGIMPAVLQGQLILAAVADQQVQVPALH